MFGCFYPRVLPFQFFEPRNYFFPSSKIPFIRGGTLHAFHLGNSNFNLHRASFFFPLTTCVCVSFAPRGRNVPLREISDSLEIFRASRPDQKDDAASPIESFHATIIVNVSLCCEIKGDRIFSSRIVIDQN